MTTVARTLVDLAAVLREWELERAAEEAERLRLFDGAAVDDALARASGKRGVGALRRILAGLREPPFTRSELERRFAELCRDHGIAPPSFNASVLGYEVDALWEAERLIVELDGYAHHGTRAAFERDRRRDAALARAGYRVLRFTWAQVTEDAAATAATVAQARAAPPVKRIEAQRTGGQTTPLAKRRP